MNDKQQHDIRKMHKFESTTNRTYLLNSNTMLGDSYERIYESNFSFEEEKYRYLRKNTTPRKTHNNSHKFGNGVTSPTMSGNQSKGPVQIGIDQIRPGLFYVHCQWDKPNDPVPANQNANLLANSFAELSFGGNQQQQAPAFGFGTTSSSGDTKTTAGPALKPAFSFTTSVPSTSTSSTSISTSISTPQSTKAFLAKPVPANNNSFAGFSFKPPAQSLSFFGTTSSNNETKTTAGPAIKPAFSFATSVPPSTSTSSTYCFGAPEKPQQQQTSNLDEKAQAKSSRTSQIPLRFFSNTSEQPDTKGKTVKYVAEFTVNQQAYILKASFTTSACNIVGSLALKQIQTKSRLVPDKATADVDDLVETDDIRLPSAVWANFSGTEKKYHNFTLSSLDHSWVWDDFDGSFACFTSFNAGPTYWKPLACSVWIQFEASNMREKKALQQITDLYAKQTYCDVQFSLKDDQHIGAHRYILMARSPVFAAMFQNDMEETTTGQVKIEDCEPDIFKQLLHYIYSGKTSSPLTDAMAQSLFVLADKYDIQDLKEECVTFLLTCVRMDNVVGLLVWSHLHSIEELKEVTLTYMARNGKEICLLKDLEELAKNYPDLSVLAFRLNSNFDKSFKFSGSTSRTKLVKNVAENCKMLLTDKLSCFPKMTGRRSRRSEFEIVVEQVRRGLFCVHFQCNKPNKSMVENKNTELKNPIQLGNNNGNSNANKAAISNHTTTSVVIPISRYLSRSEMTQRLLARSLHERNLSRTLALPNPKIEAPQNQNSIDAVDNCQAPNWSTVAASSASESSSVGTQIAIPSANTPSASSINTSGLPAKDDAIQFTADFLINKQLYVLKASFATSKGITLGSLDLKQMKTKPCPATEKVVVDKVSSEPSCCDGIIENDNILSPSAVWVNLSGIEKKHRKLKFSNSDQSWVSDDFDGSFARSAGPTDWKPLAGLLWIEFENMGERKALKQVTDLYVEQIYCDVQFSLRGEQQIGGHRSILAARSPVFAGMFQHGMEEAITGQVHIEESEPEVFKQLLHYIYSGRISTPLTDAKAQSLFVVADKYDIRDLKEECVTFLLTCVRMDNVVGLLVWSHIYSVDELKEVTLTFMARNGKKICRLKDWEELAKSYPDLSVLATRRMMDCTVYWEGK
ncbi:hypothetical protein GHT06_010533 [Daphnia sinensis]|uniref:BTB domain-containing protein n=1 Tax=Daphnia sinensis TaxID=1820382 RepID=A0AAD5KYL0_9CRUS|nr:hypothetical protein GHT06_010533 [Daphnia sinensis]